MYIIYIHISKCKSSKKCRFDIIFFWFTTHSCVLLHNKPFFWSPHNVAVSKEMQDKDYLFIKITSWLKNKMVCQLFW